jgi:hypothetical protein
MSNEFNTDDASIDSIDFVDTRETSESIQQLARELDEAKAEDFMRKSSLSNEMKQISDISEMTDGYSKHSALKKNKRPPSIRISMLPDSIRETAMELDKNQDGDLSLGELAFAIDDLDKKQRSNKNLKRTIAGFIVLMVAMVVCIFAASITAARLSKDFNVDPNTGMSLVKDASEPTVVKTHSALFLKEGIQIAELSNKELGNLKQIVLEDGDLRFVVKGYSRDPFDAEKKVIVLIEGGTITYDTDGILEATGNAKLALEALYGLDIFDDEGRRLAGLVGIGEGYFSKE